MKKAYHTKSACNNF